MSSLPTSDDERIGALLERHCKGDDEATSTILAEHGPWLRSTVRRKLTADVRQLIDTEDIVLETFEALLRLQPRFVLRSLVDFRNYMARCIQNRIYDHRKKASVRPVTRPMYAMDGTDSDTPTIYMGEPSATTSAMPMSGAVRNEDAAIVRLALALLSTRDADVLFLRHWEELTFPEIGERLGISEEAARKAYDRAIPKLARAMIEVRSGRFDSIEQHPDEPDD
ncbi:MAG: RNA polymerase sigma factor [Planctomycetes bacterium]|nr:RNA polymerase sigma factor [Planctomycetota bacterium]